MTHLTALREIMERERLNACLFTGSAPHQRENTADHWASRQWVSGFTGSVGTAVVTMTGAALWTDARHAPLAAGQLRGTEFALMQQDVASTPTVSQWLSEQIDRAPQPYCDWREVAVDGLCCPFSTVRTLISDLRAKGGITVRTNFDPLRQLWRDRPPVPCQFEPLPSPAETTRAKLMRIRQALRERHADGMLMAALDDVTWTLNVRAVDAAGKPALAAYLLIAPDSVTLFAPVAALSPAAVCRLKSDGISVADYADVVSGLRRYFGYNVLLDPDEVSYTLYKTVLDNRQPVAGLKSPTQIVEAPSPVPLLRA